MPWKRISTSPSGTLRLCCLSSGEIGLVKDAENKYVRLPTSLAVAFNQQGLQKVRAEMLSGQWPDACRKCQQLEEDGLKSERIVSLELHPEMLTDKLSTNCDINSVRELDLRLGNHCNLKCRMCSPYSSSTWKADWQALGNTVSQIPQGNLQRLESGWERAPKTIHEVSQILPHLRLIYLTGGEPVLSKSNLLILKAAIASGNSQNITIRYTTNGTFICPESVELWSHFQSIQIGFSIDGVGPINEYIRYPTKWSKVVTNLKRYQELSQILPLQLTAMATAQIYNVFQLSKLIDYCTEQNVPLEIDIVTEPQRLSLRNMTPQLARQAFAALGRYAERNKKIPGVLAALQAADGSEWPAFIEYTLKLDKIRGQNIIKVCPEFRDHFLQDQEKSGHVEA